MTNERTVIERVDDAALAAGADVEQAVLEAARALGQALRTAGLRITTAESCTGGLAAAALTHWPGSSDWFDGALVSYSNGVKRQWLGVSAQMLERDGAVSRAVAAQMAEGALTAFPGAGAALSITGVAGPDGGTAAKPVGTVWFGWALRGDPDGRARVHTEVLRLPGSRAAVRAASALHALTQMRLRLMQDRNERPVQA